MTVGIDRLEFILNIKHSQDKEWILSRELNKKDAAYFKSLILNYQILTIEYGILRNHLVKIYHDKSISQQEKNNSAFAALFLAEWLTYIYQHHLIEPGEVERLEQDQIHCRQLLKMNGINLPEITASHKRLKVSQQVRIKTREVNPLRLTFIRSKRVLDALVPIIKNLEQFRRGMVLINKVLNPILAYVAWLFFLPRLTINLFHLFSHTIAHPWMSAHEKNLGFLVRFTAQLQQRWFEIGNDLVWSVAGLLACFVWLGPLAPVGIYINVALYAYDVVLMGIRVAIDIWRLTRLQQSYQTLIRNADSDEKRQEALGIEEQLRHKMAFDYKKLAIALLTTIALFVAIVICLPSLAMSPFVPFIGACLLLAVTLINYGANKYLDKHEPSGNLQNLLPPESSQVPESSNCLSMANCFSFFKKTPSDKGNRYKPADNLNRTAEFQVI